MADFTMYDREREFKWQIECQLRGGTNAYIDAEDIYSGRLTRQISSGEGIEVGSCYVSELDLTIVASALPSNVISVKPYFRLLTSTEIVDDVVRKYYTPYNLGVFKIASTKRKEYGRIDLVCYDKMADLDTLITPAAYTELLASDWKPFYLLDWIATKVNVTYTFTQSGVEAMPNGTLYFKLAEETSNIKTYRDLLQYVCMLIGAYGIFDEDGHLNIKTFADTTSYSLPASFRFSESFGDVPIVYSGVELTVKNATTMFGNANNTVVRLSDNPFLYTLSNLNQTTDYATFIMQFLRNIYTEFQGLSYYAGEFEIPPDASLNVGRLLAVSGGGASDTINCFLQKIDVNFDGRMSLSCGNPNTYVTRTQNRTTSSIANLTNRIETLESLGSGKEVYYGTSLPTVDIGQDSSLYYKIIQRPEDLKTLNVMEYITAQKGAYIPTDICPTSDTRIEMVGWFTTGDWHGFNPAFGTDGNANSNRYGRVVIITSGFETNNTAAFWYGNDSWYLYRNAQTPINQKCTIICDIATRTCFLNGTETSAQITVPEGFIFQDSLTPLAILARNISNTAGGMEVYDDYRDTNGGARIYSFRVYQKGIIAYDMIPVINANNPEDGGLYDRIHRKYYPAEWCNTSSGAKFVGSNPTGEVINQLDECVEAGYLRVNDEWWEIYNGGTEYFAGNYIEITENNVITSTLKAGTNIQIADDGTISASATDVTQIVTSGTELATINGTSIYAPTVSATQTQTSGTEIATINVGDTSTKLYAPTTTVTQTLTEGTEIGEVNGTKLYAPTGGGSDVTVTPITTTGTNIANIAVNGTTYHLFAPSGGGGGGSGSGYTETSLWSGTQTATGTITLSDSIQNYDIIVLRWSPHHLSTNYYQRTDMILVSSVMLGLAYQYLISEMIVGGDYSSFASCHFEDYTHFVLDEVTSGNIFTFTFLEVIGLKFGGGSSGHNYSTDEQVVGTWIDGSTVYEKTQYGGITFSTQGKWYDTDITNIDKIVSVQGSINRNGEPINLGWWYSSVASVWILRNHTLKLEMQEMASGETYTLNSITVQYTKTS